MVDEDVCGPMTMKYHFSPWFSVLSQLGSMIQKLLNLAYTIVFQPQYSHLYNKPNNYYM